MPAVMGSQQRPPDAPPPAGLTPAPEPSPGLQHRSDYRLVRTLLTLQSDCATGTLRVDAEGVLTVVRLRDGHPVFVEGGLPADSLGRLLVARGQLTESMLAQVEEQRMVMQGRLRFGEVAKRLGAIEKDVLDAALREQVRAKLARCLHWERSQHAFQAEEHGIEALPGEPLTIEPLLLTGIARHFTAQRIQDVLAPTWHEPIELRSDFLWVAERLGLDAEDKVLFAEMRKAGSIGQLLCGPAYRKPRMSQIIVALAMTDQLRMPELEVPDESGPFVIDLLERTPRQKSSRTPTQETGPTTVAKIDLGRRSMPPIQEVGNLPGKDKLLADSAFLQGKELLRAGEHGAAADAFREASNLRPGAREYALFAAWPAYLSTGRAKKWRDMLVELCEKTLEQDRLLAFAHHVKGQLALELNDLTTARDAFTRALELDPQDDEAKLRLTKLSH